LKQARAFYTLILLSTGVGVGLDFAGINPRSMEADLDVFFADLKDSRGIGPIQLNLTN
jgi:hypothetical protein